MSVTRNRTRVFFAVMLVLGAAALGSSGTANALTIKPVFTSGPCPVRAPAAGEGVCPNAQAVCPVFHDSTLVPSGYDAVTYCGVVMSESVGIWPNLTLATAPLSTEEQAAWSHAASRVQAYVRDEVGVTFEVYK